MAVVTEFNDIQGTFADARKLVIVRLDDGTEREVFEIATNVINFWGQELTRLGVLDGYRPFALPDSPGTRPLSRDEVRGLDLELIQGVRFTQHLRMQRYNPIKGCAEPIDPTGSELRACIYKPNVTLDVTLTNHETGDQRQFALQLTEEQAKSFEALPTDQSKQLFIRQLLAETRGLLPTTPAKKGSSDAAGSDECA